MDNRVICVNSYKKGILARLETTKLSSTIQSHQCHPLTSAITATSVSIVTPNYVITANQ
jgi:hypothetical protein